VTVDWRAVAAAAAVGDGAGDEPKTAFVDRHGGLLVATFADAVIGLGPLAEGTDDILWSYADGVWSPDKHVVRSRASGLLGERYRRTHSTNTEDVVRTKSRRITCEPISEAINFRNGLYLWRPDALHDHTPDVLSTVQLSIDWDPDATCPGFDMFLSQVVPADMVDLVWELIGYLLYSGNPLHKAIMLMGSGRNGKGTFLRVVTALLGARNTTSVSLHDLVNTRFSTASLFGKIANIAGDIDGTYLESTATFKAITGQDQISAEHKGRDRFDFTPWAVPVFSANKIPASSDVTVGYLSRWLVVPFPNDFTGREDRTLDRRLQAKAELQGIAVKAMPALRRLMARGDFDLPESGRQARDEFTRG
jgi:P4 family phage/plasmid primase-like protien